MTMDFFLLFKNESEGDGIGFLVIVLGEEIGVLMIYFLFWNLK